MTADNANAGWEFVTDCETAGPLTEAVKAGGKEDELPVRAHPWLPAGMVLAFNRDKLPPAPDGMEALF